MPPHAASHHLPRVLPFAVFMGFIALNDLISRFTPSHASLSLFLYPVRTAMVALILIHYRQVYDEIRWRDLARIPHTILSILTGAVIFILWITMTWDWATFGEAGGYDPTPVREPAVRFVLVAFRMIGAALVVPVMEELFWRSWLLRYLVSPDFTKVPVGTFSLSSFLIGSLLFGVEHHLWLAGIVAGVSYSLLCYRTGSIAHCILSHAVTNALLGGYVIAGERWEFW